MKKIFFAALVFSLAGCSSQSNQQIITLVNDVQLATQTACKFVPTAATIADIISAGSAAVPSQIAQVICQAIDGNPVKSASAELPLVTVNGRQIEVTGYFTK